MPDNREVSLFKSGSSPFSGTGRPTYAVQRAMAAPQTSRNGRKAVSYMTFLYQWGPPTPSVRVRSPRASLVGRLAKSGRGGEYDRAADAEDHPSHDHGNDLVEGLKVATADPIRLGRDDRGLYGDSFTPPGPYGADAPRLWHRMRQLSVGCTWQMLSSLFQLGLGRPPGLLPRQCMPVADGWPRFRLRTSANGLASRDT